MLINILYDKCYYFNIWLKGLAIRDRRMVLKEKELNMKKDNEISVVSSVSDVIDTTSGIVTNIFKAHIIV